MSYPIFMELWWLAALLLVVFAFSASTVVLVTARHLPDRVNKCLTWLAATGFLGTSTVGFTIVLQLVHVPITSNLWNAHTFLTLGTAVAYVIAAEHLSALAEELEELSM